MSRYLLAIATYLLAATAFAADPLPSWNDTGPKKAIFSKPLHPYSELLLRSAPSHDPHHRHQFSAVSDDIPSATKRPPGCAFHTRCPLATEICRQVEPQLEMKADGQSVACHHR